MDLDQLGRDGALQPQPGYELLRLNKSQRQSQARNATAIQSKSIPVIEIYKNPEFANHIFNYSLKTIEISQMKVIELPKLR